MLWSFESLLPQSSLVEYHNRWADSATIKCLFFPSRRLVESLLLLPILAPSRKNLALFYYCPLKLRIWYEGIPYCCCLMFLLYYSITDHLPPRIISVALIHNHCHCLITIGSRPRYYTSPFDKMIPRYERCGSTICGADTSSLQSLRCPCSALHIASH